jgi:coenzyme PQQ biosynthesis protein PqqD
MDSKKPMRIFDIWKYEEEIQGIPKNVKVLTPEGILSFNTVASYVWILCDGKHTVGEIIEKVRGKFSGDEEKIKTDIHKFINKLYEKKLIDFL